MTSICRSNTEAMAAPQGSGRSSTGRGVSVPQFIRRWAARRAMGTLTRLDDYILNDVGLRREEIEWAAGLPLTMNAALALEERARRRV